MDHMQEKHLDTARGFHYRYYVSPQQADASKPLLLLCHGFPDSAHLWQYMLPYLLKTNLRIVAPDLLGYGGTSKPAQAEHYVSKPMAQDVMEIVEAEVLPSQLIIPIGHDWGSFFAQRFYLLYSERCAALITLAVAYMPPDPKPFNLPAALEASEAAFGYPSYAYWELFTAADGPDVLQQHLASMWHVMHGEGKDWMKQMFCTRGAMRLYLEADRQDAPLKPYAQDASLRDAWIQAMRTGGMAGPCSWYRATADNHQLEVEQTIDSEIDKPYLFIGCDGDAVCRTDLVRLPIQQGLLEDVTVHELESGHWCPYERPREVSDLIVQWLHKKAFIA